MLWVQFAGNAIDWNGETVRFAPAAFGSAVRGSAVMGGEKAGSDASFASQNPCVVTVPPCPSEPTMVVSSVPEPVKPPSAAVVAVSATPSPFEKKATEGSFTFHAKSTSRFVSTPRPSPEGRDRSYWELPDPSAVTL